MKLRLKKVPSRYVYEGRNCATLSSRLHPVDMIFRSNPHWWLLAALLAWLAPVGLQAQTETAAATGKDGKLLDETWALLKLQGKRVGFSSTVVTERDTPNGKQYVTRMYEQLALKRMGRTLRITSDNIITEDEKGEIVNFQAISQGVGTYKKVRGYRVGDKMVILSGNVKRSHPFPSDALGPYATEQEMMKMPLRPGEKKTLNSFMADSPTKAVEQRFAVVSKTEITLEGEPQQVWELTAEVSILPGVIGKMFIDGEFDVKLMEMPLPAIGTLEIVSTTRAKAMEKIEATEVFSKTLVQPNRPIPNYHRLDRAKFRLLTNPPNKDLPIYEGEGQRVLERLEDGSVIVETTRPKIKPSDASYNLPIQPTPELKTYLRESAYLERTPLIEKLAKQAVGDEKNPVKAAHKIDKFVRGYIQRKNLGVGFASAQETATNRQGDCTEHGVLCAALGRAVGMPTRVVTGFGYLPMDYAGDGDPNKGTFGFHMWAEAYVAPGKWVPMDAALGQFTVCHIAISKSNLDESNPFVELSMPIFELLQSLKIDVLETE